MEPGVLSSPFQARWMLRPLSLALSPPLLPANRSRAALSLMHLATNATLAPHAAAVSSPPPPPSSSYWAERQILAIISNVVPASLVLLYAIWPCAFVQRFVLALPLISWLKRALRPFVSFDDIVVSLEAEKRTLSPADLDDEDAAAAAATPAEAGESTPLLADGKPSTARPRWPAPSVTIGLCVVSLMHLGVLLGHFCYVAAGHMWNAGEEPFSEVVTDLVLRAAGWAYIAVRTLCAPQPTPPYDTLVLLFVLLASSVVRLHLICISWYDGSGLYASPGLQASAAASSILLCLYALSLVFSLPITVLTPQMQAVLGYTSVEAALAAPADPTVDASKITSPDAYCSLWQWVSFRWIDSILEASKKGKLGEDDVWRLGADLKARVLDRKWGQLHGVGVIKRIWIMNSRDMLIDFFLTIVSTVNAYAKPLVLKRVLEGIQAGQRNSDSALGVRDVWMALYKGGSYTSHETAYAIAALGLVLVAVGSEADLQHLYAGRRCAVRTRGELISAMFSKGMRCKDISGAVAAVSGEKPRDSASETSSDAGSTKAASTDGKDAEPSGEDKKASKEQEDMKKAEEAQGGQGVGRAVSLMSVDANGVGMFLSMLYFLYGAPLDLIVCLIMLYTQLGWSAFVGFAVVPVVIPLQSIVMGQMIKLYKKVGNVRDSRMAALSELINNLRLIKLISWEGKFQERVLKLRNQELRLQFLRAVVGSMMNLIWSLAPASISVLGFASYTILYKQPLTVPIAFTALNLYQQLNRPLGVLPMMINHTVSMLVSAGRIQRFLDYPEVPEGISTLHRAITQASMPLRNNVIASDATFRWHSNMPFDEPDKPKQPRFASVRRALSKAAFWRKDVSETSAPKADTPDTASSSASSSADPNAGSFTLHNITLTVDEGLTLVCGSTGSGKSSLLAGLLGEMDLLSGKLLLDKQPGIVDPATGLHGGISFCAQQPWLQQKSVRDNILFGEPMDIDRYKAVLEACALMPDIELFDDGDLQEIGEGGISLSGGQKARVALARAVYSKARTVLLDDVLSAVDAHTAQKLVTECLTGPLMQRRCILLVTHHVDLVLSYVQRAIKLEKGVIAAMGPVHDLVASGAIEVHTGHDLKGKGKSSAPSSPEPSTHNEGGKNKGPVKPDKPSKIGPLDGSKATHKIVEQEKVRVGRVKSKVYGVYLNALGWFMIGLVGFTLVLCNVTELSSSVWLSYWSSGGSKCEAGDVVDAPVVLLTTAGTVYHSRWTPFLVKLMLRFHLQIRALTVGVATKHCWLPPAGERPLPYMLIFALIEFVTCIMSVVTNILMYVASLRASRALFVRMLDSVCHATTRWLDKTPSGQILNRFGKDIESLDFGLLQSSSTVLFQIFSLLTAFATLAVLVPAFIIPALGVIWLYYSLSKVYVACSRDLRRLESAHRSPIFSGYSEALKGIATIRAFSAETRLLYEVYGKVDAFSSAHYFWWMTNRWLMLRVDLVGGVCVFATQFLALSGAMSAGMAAVAITQAANFTMSCYWLSRGWANLEQELTSIERVVDYLPPKIPQEPPQYIEGHEAPAAWPSTKATIKFDDVWLRYDKSFDPVLKGVSFEIRPGEKVGIVGRTGSGKSTCASSLLRFVDPEKGSISIDGIDIRTLGLHDLRSRISFIPQDPVLFQGRVRDNLDPFDEHTDAECRNALAQVRLSRSPTASQAVSRAPSRPGSVHDGDEGVAAPELEVGGGAGGESNDLTLDSPVADSGGNLSQGQRQLLAMARALLSNNHIVIADEATASVDFASDRVIQQVIRDRFKDNIMLVIAHRLTTIAEFSRVLVLDAGRVVEFDTPANLLRNKTGYFCTMAQHSGVYDTLVKMAHHAA